MTEIRFVTREIGTLAKPGWHVQAIASQPSRDKSPKRRESGLGTSAYAPGASRDPPQGRGLN